MSHNNLGKPHLGHSIDYDLSLWSFLANVYMHVKNKFKIQSLSYSAANKSLNRPRTMYYNL